MPTFDEGWGEGRSSPTDRLARWPGGPPPLFVYGSLLFPDVLRVLLDRLPADRPAALSGWRVAALTGRAYPALVPAPGAEAIEGRLLTDLTADEWRTIDAYEDHEYELTEVTLDDGTVAVTYTWIGTAGVEAIAWDRSAFEQTDLPDYLLRSTAWRQVRGQPGV